jgi:hypothetical protein
MFVSSSPCSKGFSPSIIFLKVHALAVPELLSMMLASYSEKIVKKNHHIRGYGFKKPLLFRKISKNHMSIL